MFSCPHVSFSSNSTSNDNNLMWSTNGYDIFVDYHCNDELFMDFSFTIENVFQFPELFPLGYIPTCLVIFFIITFL
jgi:hypothetical protein